MIDYEMSKDFTVKKLVLAIQTIDFDPLHQRPQVQDSRKKEGIIRAILEGFDIGEIKLNRKEDDTLEAIDGSNRMRAIVQFQRGEFTVNEKYFSDLTKDEQETFFNYPLRVVTYNNMTPEQKAHQFQVTNTVTLVNFMEMLNSYGTLPIACLVRDLVRDTGSDDSPDEVFDYSINSKGKMVCRFLSFDNSRLLQEELTARIVTLLWQNEGLTSHGKGAIEAMYKASHTEKSLRALRGKTKDCFKFMRKIASARIRLLGGGLNQREFTLLFRLYFYLNETYGAWDVICYDEFFKAFRVAADKFWSATATRKELVRDPGSDEDRLIGEAFKGYLGHQDSVYKVRQPVMWLLEEFNVQNYITVKDKTRCFPREMVESILLQQDGRDWVDGKPLTMRDAVGAHWIAATDGGSASDPSNCIVTSAKHNQRMGTMTPGEYRDALMARETQPLRSKRVAKRSK